MTDPTEHLLRETFHAAAIDAPPPDDLAGKARARASRHRLTTVAASVLTVAVIGGVFLITRDPGETAQPALVQPLFTGNLTAQECPNGTNGSTTPFYGERQQFPPAREQAEKLGRSRVLPEHPDARLLQTASSAVRVEFTYVLPNGYRVAVIHYIPGPDGWYLEGMQDC